MRHATLRSVYPMDVAGIGMVTSLGLDAVTGCASARAGLCRVKELEGKEYLGEMAFDDIPPKGHAVPLEVPGLRGIARLQALAKAALSSLSAETRLQGSRTAFLMVLPDRFLLQALVAGAPGTDEEWNPTEAKPRPGMYSRHEDTGGWQAKCAVIPERLLARFNLDIPDERRCLAFGGAAETAMILAQAAEWLRSGHADRCIVGAVDSFLDPVFFKACVAYGTWDALDVSIMKWPGEGACFLALERAAKGMAKAGTARILGASWSAAEEIRFSGGPSTGRPMSAAIRGCFDGDGGGETSASPERILATLAGDSLLASDLGKAMVRVQTRFPKAGRSMEFPAASFGDCGAAMGLMALAVLRQSVRRDDSLCRDGMICAYSDNGNIGAIRARTER